MALFWLRYRNPNGSFAGVVMIESNALVNARMRVAISGADKCLPFISGEVLDDDSARQVPVDMLGRLLSPADLQKLERMLLKKTSTEASAPRARPGPRSGKS